MVRLNTALQTTGSPTKWAFETCAGALLRIFQCNHHGAVRGWTLPKVGTLGHRARQAPSLQQFSDLRWEQLLQFMFWDTDTALRAHDVDRSLRQAGLRMFCHTPDAVPTVATAQASSMTWWGFIATQCAFLCACAQRYRCA
mmetsp:Transcript_137105/g.273457  ORF Transcript_137105/g.273457 Transcript_137105/m.273457 type:complete len:141 (-) Transcript_137105:420-842(-)